MISKYNYKDLTWIDLESPTKQEVLDLMDEYDIPQLVGEELLTTTVRSRVDVYDNLLYLILRFPTHAGTDDPESEQEIDFIIGEHFLITAHYELIDPLHEFSKVFEVNSVLNKDTMGTHAGYMFYFIAKELYKHSLDELEHVNSDLKRIGKQIFEGHEAEMVEALSHTNRKLLNFKQALRFHDGVLQSFEIAARRFFGEDFSTYLHALQGEYKKVKDMLDTQKEILDDLRETNDSLLSSKTNETMKTLTIMTFVMLPITLIASIFSMNSSFFLINSISDFVVVLAAMTITGIIMFIYFKGKRWL